MIRIHVIRKNKMKIINERITAWFRVKAKLQEVRAKRSKPSQSLGKADKFTS